jgi:hypothetical protein
MLERLKTTMIGLWYPAVLGTLLILFIDRWAGGTAEASRPSTWFGLFILLYYTILFEESVHSRYYTVATWLLDLCDLVVMYCAYGFLGFGFGNKAEKLNWFFGIMIVGFVEPVIWRALEDRRERALDLLCGLAIVVMLLGIPLPEWYAWVALVVVCLLLCIYVIYAAIRIRRAERGELPARATGVAE